MASIITISGAGEREHRISTKRAFCLTQRSGPGSSHGGSPAEEVAGDLTEDHWKVIDFLRAYYDDCKSVPPVPML